MKNMVKIQARAYSVELRDIRTDEIVTDSVILTREQLKAADDTGLTLAGLMTALYDRKGYHVVKIGTPVKQDIAVRLSMKDNRIVIDTEPAPNPRERMSGKELAILAAVNGGDDLRHYCEYLKAHGYCGDAFKDATGRPNHKARKEWAVNTYNKFIFRMNDDDDYKLRTYMLNPDKPLSGSPEDEA